MSKQVASVGRIVHFVMQDGAHVGEHRPAIIVQVWNDEMVNLQVFTDGENDYPPAGPVIKESVNVKWFTSRHQDETDKRPGTWHFPEYVPAKD